MIVNSRRGGGSKDTWVLDGAATAPSSSTAPTRRRSRRRCPTCGSARAGSARPSSSSSSAPDARPDRARALLAGPQPRARRGHRAHARRRLPVHAPGRSPTSAPGSSLDWEAVVAIMGVTSPEAGERREDVVRRVTLDPFKPALGHVVRRPRARRGARTVRDVISADMWQAINTPHLGLRDRVDGRRACTGPYAVFQYVKERCAMFWGLATGRCSATRPARSSPPAAGSSRPT